jgi:hypothetical protein
MLVDRRWPAPARRDASSKRTLTREALAIIGLQFPVPVQDRICNDDD